MVDSPPEPNEGEGKWADEGERARSSEGRGERVGRGEERVDTLQSGRHAVGGEWPPYVQLRGRRDKPQPHQSDTLEQLVEDYKTL